MHTVVLVGQEGTGKTTIAKQFRLFQGDGGGSSSGGGKWWWASVVVWWVVCSGGGSRGG